MPEPALLAIDWTFAGYAVALLALAVVLLVFEFFIVSFGLLLAGAVAATAAALYFAFRAGDAVGWAMAVVVPILAGLVVRWGLKRIRASRIVPKSEITEEAGYHHVADRLGIGRGSVGTMVTPARPSGRARFPGGECDVQVRGGTLEAAARVVVKEIDGPIIFVSPAGGQPPSPPPARPPGVPP